MQVEYCIVYIMCFVTDHIFSLSNYDSIKGNIMKIFLKIWKILLDIFIELENGHSFSMFIKKLENKHIFSIIVSTIFIVIIFLLKIIFKSFKHPSCEGMFLWENIYGQIKI